MCFRLREQQVQRHGGAQAHHWRPDEVDGDGQHMRVWREELVDRREGRGQGCGYHTKEPGSCGQASKDTAKRGQGR